MSVTNFRLRATAIVVHSGKLLTFFAIDPHDGREFYFLPGGAIDEDETAPEAAERECLEETGFWITVDTQSCIDKDYSFYWNGQNYDCTTLFYKGTLKSSIQRPRTQEEPDYNKGVYWIPLEQIPEKLNYNETILSVVLGFLKS